MRREMAQQQVLADAEIGDDTLRAPVLRHEAEPGADRVGRALRVERPPGQLEFTAAPRTNAENRLYRFGSPGADQPAQPQDFPCPQRE